MVILDSFSSNAVDLKRGQRTNENVLAVLAKSPLISHWDMSEHLWLWHCVRNLEKEGLIQNQDEPFPWLRYELTDAGKEAVGA